MKVSLFEKQEELSLLKQINKENKNNIDKLNRSNSNQKREIDALNKENNELLASSSWKVTNPLRKSKQIFKK